MHNRQGQSRQTVHRAETGRRFEGIPIHAAAGVHEHAVAIAQGVLTKGSRVLDAGTGSGALAARLVAKGFDVVASDLNTDDYRAAAPVVRWDVTNPPPKAIPEGSLDAVCAVELLEHLENPRAALRNFFRVLRPGGVLIASTPNVAHPRSRLKFLLRGAPSYFGTTEYYGSGHITMLPSWLLALHIREAGFVDTGLEYAGRLGLSGRQLLAYRLLEPLFRVCGAMPSPRVDDGCVTFATAWRPAQAGENAGTYASRPLRRMTSL